MTGARATVTFVVVDDAVPMAFADAGSAVAAALNGQRDVGGSARIGIATGDAVRDEEGLWTGAVVDRARGLADLAVPGEVLVSVTTAAIIADSLPDGAWLEDSGRSVVVGSSRTEPVHQLGHPDLQVRFTPHRAKAPTASSDNRRSAASACFPTAAKAAWKSAPSSTVIDEAYV